MFFGAKEFYDMYYITLLLLETSLELEISRKTKFQSPFLFDLLLHYWFCVNFQMSTEWGFDLANNAIVIYCLIYFLNIPLSNQYSSFSPVENSVSAFFEHWHFTDILRCCSERWGSNTNIIFLCVTLQLPR